MMHKLYMSMKGVQLRLNKDNELLFSGSSHDQNDQVFSFSTSQDTQNAITHP